MTLLGHVRNGVIVTDNPMLLPEGTSVRIEVMNEEVSSNSAAPRQGGQYAGQIWMAPDFDGWPNDFEGSLGMTP